VFTELKRSFFLNIIFVGWIFEIADKRPQILSIMNAIYLMRQNKYHIWQYPREDPKSQRVFCNKFVLLLCEKMLFSGAGSDI
jgi:hypothetical protein